jgi:predicted nucleic acid-binding protein
MTFASIPSGASVFLDANPFIYYFLPHATLGPACKVLLERIENQDLRGFTSADVLGDVAHRIMTLEAVATFGWPLTGIAQRLKAHPSEVQALNRYRQAIDEIGLIGIQVVPTTGRLVSLAADVSRQTGLLTGDALVTATMRDLGLTLLASHDADFDRIPGISRFSPG